MSKFEPAILVPKLFYSDDNPEEAWVNIYGDKVIDVLVVLSMYYSPYLQRSWFSIHELFKMNNNAYTNIQIKRDYLKIMSQMQKNKVIKTDLKLIENQYYRRNEVVPVDIYYPLEPYVILYLDELEKITNMKLMLTKKYRILALFLYICGHINETTKQGAWVSALTMSRTLGITRDTVFTYLNHLYDAGLLVVAGQRRVEYGTTVNLLTRNRPEYIKFVKDSRRLSNKNKSKSS